MSVFADRWDAGERLADLLEERGVEADVVVAVPRGGLPVGRTVADRLGARLDVVVATKLGAPGNPELAIGAAAGDGSVWWNEEILDSLGVDRGYADRERDREVEAAAEKVRAYRGDAEPLDLTGLRVVVVDDGVATGATIRACLRQVRAAAAARVVLAVPVGSPEAVAELRSEADEVVVVDTPVTFSAVGHWYRSFDQVSDAEAMALLDR